MSSKKKNRKGHNHTKRARRFFRGTTIEHWDAWGEHPDGSCFAQIAVQTNAGPAYLEQGKDDRLINSILSMHFEWNVKFIINCIAPNNEKYFEERELITSSVKLDDLHEIAKTLKADCRASVNSKHITTEGWVARVVR